MSLVPPLIEPRDTYSLWYHSPYSAQAASESASGAHPQQQQSQRNKSHSNLRLTVLQQLELDEQRLRRRKENVSKFGSTWIKPPGITKTLQAMVDEAQERAEQEDLARREAAMAEQQAAAEAANRGLQPGRFAFGTDGSAGPGTDEIADERDLDDDIPEAEEAELADEDEENEDDEDEEPIDMADDDEDDNMLQDNEDEEQDLDNDIPEAGSYQHTDTDVEDESSDDSSPIVPGPTIVQDFNPPLTSVATMADDASMAADSSMLDSSPSVPRSTFQRPHVAATLARQPQRSRFGQRSPPDQPDFSRSRAN